MIKKVIMNLDLSRASGPDYIPVVVLKNCELELSYILVELFIFEKLVNNTIVDHLEKCGLFLISSMV